MKKLSHILQCDRFYIEGFAVFLFILGYFHFWFLSVAIFYVIWQRRVLKIPFLVIMLSVIFMRLWLFEQQVIPYEIENIGYVTEIKSYDNSDLLTIRIDGKYYQVFSESGMYSYGDEIFVKAAVNPLRNRTIPFGFDQKSYMLSKNISGMLDIESWHLIRSHDGFYTIREHLAEKISRLEGKDYINALILGERSFDTKETEVYRDLGILYLFTVSGIHIYAFLFFAKKIFFYLSLEENTQVFLIMIIELIFLYLNAFSMSTTRIFMVFMITQVSRFFKWELSRLDIIHLAFGVMLVIHIQWIYHLGFLMLFVILNFLELLKDRYESQSGYIKGFLMSGVVLISILPFQDHISVLMIIMMPVMIFILSTPVFLLSIVVIMIPEMDHLFNDVIIMFEQLSLILNDKNVSIYLPALPFEALIIYYAVVIYSFRAPNFFTFFKRAMMLGFVFSWFVFDVSITQELRFYMIDVGQGDSMLIESPQCNIVIDSYQYVLPLLHDLGISHLDYLILTHSDDDHIREAQSLIDQFAIDQVLINPYNDYPIDFHQVTRVQHGDQVKCGTLSIQFYGPLKHYEDTNNNALVFSIQLDDMKFLFTGDIEYEAEMDLVSAYKDTLKSDVLKIAHHGSDTSSSKIFLDVVDPKIALISVGAFNRYGFPDREVLDRLMRSNILIYRTDQMGTIEYRDQQKKGKWVLHLPF